MMSIDVARASQLSDFYNNHPNLFEKPALDWEQLTLAIFLLYERQKGPESKWAPYLDVMPHVKFFCHAE
jgi:hypothetical protein